MAILVRRENPRCLDSRILRDELSATLALYTGASKPSRYRDEDFLTPRGCFLLARAADGHVLGFGAFSRHTSQVAEITHLYVRSEAYGVGSRILSALEVHAIQAGYAQLLLETPASNRRILDFCKRHAFSEIRFIGMLGAMPAQTRCFAKRVLV